MLPDAVATFPIIFILFEGQVFSYQKDDKN